MNNIAYAGHGVEIEQDVVRLQRRKLEFDGDAARRPGPRPRRIFNPVNALSAVLASWRWPRDRIAPPPARTAG